VIRETEGRRGRATDPIWASRRRLLRGRERPSDSTFIRTWNELADNDPSFDLLRAWIAKEELRALLATAHRRTMQRHRQPPAPLLRLVRRPRRPHPRGATPGQHRASLVARDPRVPGDRGHERGHRRNQPPHQRRRPRPASGTSRTSAAEYVGPAHTANVRPRPPREDQPPLTSKSPESPL